VIYLCETKEVHSKLYLIEYSTETDDSEVSDETDVSKQTFAWADSDATESDDSTDTGGSEDASETEMGRPATAIVGSPNLSSNAWTRQANTGSSSRRRRIPRCGTIYEEHDEFKIRGIEARQRSTPPFIEAVQRSCLDRFATTRSPEAVIKRAEEAIARLHAGHVDPADLVEEVRISKPLGTYTHTTRAVDALRRADAQDHATHPGQHIKYIVVDDTKSTQDRIALVHEDPESYDASYYETKLVRAIESLLSPSGWDHIDIRRALDGYDTPELTAFAELSAE
jgi:DNA polymerase I